jgi:hypothetical protein
MNTKTIFASMEDNYILYLLANLIELGNIEYNNNIDEIYYPDFTVGYNFLIN